MKPNKLIGEIFTIPIFAAQCQKYIVKDVIEVQTTGSTINYELKFDWVPSNYQVPHEIIIQIERAVNQKRMFTLIEINNDTNHKCSLSKKLIKDIDCSTMGKLRNTFEKLGTF